MAWILLDAATVAQMQSQDPGTQTQFYAACGMEHGGATGWQCNTGCFADVYQATRTHVGDWGAAHEANIFQDDGN
jgi:hypothetical protein